MVNKVAVVVTMSGLAILVVGAVLASAHYAPPQVVCDQDLNCGEAVPVGPIAGWVLVAVGGIIAATGVFSLVRNAYVKTSRSPQISSVVQPDRRLGASAPQRPLSLPQALSRTATTTSSGLRCGSCKTAAGAGQQPGDRCYSCGGTFS